MTKPSKATKKSKATNSPLKDIVGDDVYNVWVKMLKELVPQGRTHRLSVLVASMLAYASDIASSNEQDIDEDSPAYPLHTAIEEGFEDEETQELLQPMLIRLFKDAKVKHGRVSSRGDRYSIIRDAIIEYYHWYNYPWEG